MFNLLAMVPPLPFPEYIDSRAEMLSGSILLGLLLAAVVVFLGVVLAAVGARKWGAAAFLLAIPLGAIFARCAFLIMTMGG